MTYTAKETKKSGYMYVYKGFSLLYAWNYHDTVNQLYPDKIYLKKERQIFLSPGTYKFYMETGSLKMWSGVLRRRDYCGLSRWALNMSRASRRWRLIYTHRVKAEGPGVWSSWCRRFDRYDHKNKGAWSLPEATKGGKGTSLGVSSESSALGHLDFWLLAFWNVRE